ncbi:hypothetical protein PSPTOT1_2369 [Pseudomonas syringae pv. tomato T1]|nr:hypothetical protein PSPTOT1_2369 [Pseudomonas syringae pv. tomato T1]
MQQGIFSACAVPRVNADSLRQSVHENHLRFKQIRSVEALQPLIGDSTKCAYEYPLMMQIM